MLNREDVVRQSKQVFGQFGEKLWKPNAQKNSALERKNAKDLQNIGLGKYLVCVGMGASLEDNIEALKANRDKVDILCCDKAFGVLLDHGIKADMVLIADAGIPYRWLEKYVDQTAGVKLLSTPYGNPEWTHAWKGDRYFYVNVDAIDSQKVFMPYFGQDTLVIPAGSNVSNALLCAMTVCMGNAEQNFANYEGYLLVGYDYSWRPEGNYYAFSNPRPKRQYMHHITTIDVNGDTVFTSENLLFSAKWLWMYLTRYAQVINAVNCSGRGMLDIPRRGRLQDILPRIRPEGREAVVENFHKAREAYFAFQASEQAFAKAKGGVLWQ